MSPTHDFNNIGDVLDFDIIKGTIVSVDDAEDTCVVSVAGRNLDALLFYHCEPDSVLRDNGAIEGAAAGFAEDDEVIVLVKKDREVVKVIGHVGGTKHCGSKVVIFTISLYGESVVVVWDCVNNEVCAKIEGLSFPCKASDPLYAAWLAHQSDDNTANSLFSVSTQCPGTFAGGVVSCPLLFPGADTHEHVDNIERVGTSPYWDSYAGTAYSHSIANAAKSAVAKSEYGLNSLPDNGKPYVGLRTALETEVTREIDMPVGDDVEPYASWGDVETSIYRYAYYGIQTLSPLFEFEGYRNFTGWSSFNYGYPWSRTGLNLLASAETPGGGTKSCIQLPVASGQYSDNLIVIVSYMQAVPVIIEEGDTNGSNTPGGNYYNTTRTLREVSVQSLAQYYPASHSNYGVDYTALPDNIALSAKLKAAIEYAYDLLPEVRGDEVVNFFITIRIIK